MRSQFADKFNHDPDAQGYDEDVANENNPIRAGYTRTLSWVVTQAQLTENCSVVDLGCGTGNLAAQLPACAELHCVDISGNMLELARPKMGTTKHVSFHQQDLLQFFENQQSCFDRVVSTYAIHHLTESERELLFQAIARSLKPLGRVAFGDLMFASAGHRQDYLNQLRDSGSSELAEGIEDEFFWNVEHALYALHVAGIDAHAEQLTELSWGIAGSLGESANRSSESHSR